MFEIYKIYITAIVPAVSKQLLAAGDEGLLCGAASVSSKLIWELFRSSEISGESPCSGEALFSVLLLSSPPCELVEQDSFLLLILFL